MKRPGITQFYKLEINKILDEEYHKVPMNILNILIRRKSERNTGYDAQLPTLNQIRGYKRRYWEKGFVTHGLIKCNTHIILFNTN